jgi:hypothetical protein
MVRGIGWSRSAAAAFSLLLASLVWASAELGDDPWPRAMPGLKEPAPAEDGLPAKLAPLDEVTCTQCHAAIVEQWSATSHAMAWVDELYQAELADRKKPEGCHGCHAPVPLHSAKLGSKPDARVDHRRLGVSCESCHLADDGAMLGPTGAATDAHGSRRSESMTAAGSNALCISCHRTTIGPVIGIAKDFEASALPSQGATCVGCHFAVEREVDFEGGKRKVYSHEVQTPRDPAFLALAFGLSLRVEGGKSIVSIENRAGHRVPGLIGREIEFTAQALDAGGKELAVASLKLDSSSYLPVSESLAIELPVAAAKVRVTGTHKDLRIEKPLRFLETEIAR